VNNPHMTGWRRRDVLAAGCAGAITPLLAATTTQASVGAAAASLLHHLQPAHAGAAHLAPGATRLIGIDHVRPADIHRAASLTILHTHLVQPPDAPTQSLALDVHFRTRQGEHRINALRTTTEFDTPVPAGVTMRVPIPVERRLALTLRFNTAATRLALPARPGIFVIAARNPAGALPRWRTLELKNPDDAPRLVTPAGHTPGFPHVILSLNAIQRRPA